MSKESLYPVHPNVDYLYCLPLRIYQLANPKTALQLQPPCLLLLKRGSAEAMITNKLQMMNAGDLMVHTASSALQLRASTELLAIVIEFHCSAARTSDHTGSQDHAGSREAFAVVPCPQALSDQIQQLLAAWQQRHEQPLQMQRIFLEVMEKAQLAVIKTASGKHEWIYDALQFIHCNYREELTREQLARMCGVSPEHFSRTFHRHTGCTFVSYLNLLRIRRVQRLLLTGESASLHEIAAENGFSDSYYLSRKFKQIVGSAPTVFLRRPKRIISANYNYTAMLLALDERPVLGAYSSWIKAQQPALPDNQQVELFNNKASAAYDEVKQLRPDLIIGYDRLAEDNKLLHIAPVITLPFMQLDWKEQFLHIAGIVGKQQLARTLLDHYEEKVLSLNDWLDRELGARGSLMIWELHRHGAYAFGNRFGRAGHILYDDLGFTMPQTLVDADIAASGYIDISFEQIPAYAADYMIITEPALPAQTAAVFHKAASARIIYIADPCDFFYGFDPLSTNKQLEMLLNSFKIIK